MCVVKVRLTYCKKKTPETVPKKNSIEKLRSANLLKFVLISDYLTRRFIAFRLYFVYNFHKYYSQNMALKIVSRHSSFSLTSMDFPVIINDTFHVNTKK